MSRADRDARIERLRAARSDRAAEALAAAQRAITALDSRGLAVTFLTVAREAGVSESYVRKSEVLSERIRSLRAQHPKATPAASRTTSDATVRGLRNKVEVLSDRLRRLEAENAALRAENAALRGEVADARRRARPRRSGTTSASG